MSLNSINIISESVDSYNIDEIKNLTKSFVRRQGFEPKGDFSFFDFFERVISRSDFDRKTTVEFYNELIKVNPDQKIVKDLLNIVIGKVFKRKGYRGIRRPSEEMPQEFVEMAKRRLKRSADGILKETPKKKLKKEE